MIEMDTRGGQSSLLQTNGAGSSKLRIMVPKFDNSDRIKGFNRTMIGQCMNPDKQDVKNLLYMLPRIWKMEDRVTGTNMGLGKFRFQFNNEEDIVEVQKMEPFHFDYWMLSFVKWTPSTESNYPYAIKFWVRVIGIPLHYQDEVPLQSVGRALGINEEYEQIDTLGGRVQVIIDGFKNLVFETVLVFHDGVEADVVLQYERLFGYCKVCFSLRHDRNDCPLVQREEGTRRDDQRDKGKEGAKFMSYKGAVGQYGASSKANGSGQNWRRRNYGPGNGNTKDSKESVRSTAAIANEGDSTADERGIVPNDDKMVGERVTADGEKLHQRTETATGEADYGLMEEDDLLAFENDLNEDIDLGDIDLDALELELKGDGDGIGLDNREDVDNVENIKGDEFSGQEKTQVAAETRQNKAKRVLFKNTSVPPAVNFKKRTVQKLLTPRKRQASRNTVKLGEGLYKSKHGGHGKDKVVPQEEDMNKLNG